VRLIDWTGITEDEIEANRAFCERFAELMKISTKRWRRQVRRKDQEKPRVSVAVGKEECVWPSMLMLCTTAKTLCTGRRESDENDEPSTCRRIGKNGCASLKCCTACDGIGG
jgi:hypothetical protein